MNKNYYETSDLGLAASLTASNFSILSIDKTNPRRVVFCFDKTAELLNAVDAYWSNNLHLSAMVLMEHIKLLKTRIYSGQLCN
jgi:hypothetical protein